MGASAAVKMRAADRALIWSLPLYALFNATATDTIPAIVALGIPIGVLALHRVATWQRFVYWQLTLTFLGWVAAALSWTTTSVVLGLLGIALNYAMPLPHIAGLPGAFGVGVVDYEVEGSCSPVIGRMFYPTSPHAELASYLYHDNRHNLTSKFMQIAAPKQLRKLLPEFVLSHWGSVQIAARVGSAIGGDSAKALPVVLFSHGLTASRETSTSLALSLAAQGALVLLVEHTDRSSSLARYADGTSVAFDASIFELGSEPATEAYRAARRAQTGERVGNMKATLAFLAAVHEQGSAGSERTARLDGLTAERTAALLASLRGRLALERVAVGGHSFGGCTALAFAADVLPADAPAVAVGLLERLFYPPKPPPPPSEASSPALGACFTLDPAVDWVPPPLWAAIGYDGVFNDRHYGEEESTAEPTAEREAPLVARRLPVLNIFSEGWRNAQWYQRWAATLALAPGAARPAAALAIQGCGHQGLCDLAHTLPHWLNRLLRNTLGVPSAHMGEAVNASVLAFLRNAKVLDGPATDLAEIPTTMGHVQGC